MEIIVLSVSGTLLAAFIFLLDDLRQGAVPRRHVAVLKPAAVQPVVEFRKRDLRKAA